MKQLRLLLFNEIYNMFFGRVKRKFPILMSVILPIGIMLYISAVYVYMFMESLPIEKYYYIPYLFSFGTCVLILIFSTSSKGYLFGFKDFDLLMSLPIRKELLMVVKFAGFLLLQYFYMFFLMIPMIIIYGINANMDFIYYLYSFIGLPFMPLFMVLISIVVGIIIKMISGKSKYENLISGMLSLGLFIGIYIGSFYMSSTGVEQSVQNYDKIITIIKAFMPTIYFYVNGAINGNTLHFVLNIVINIILLLIAIKIFSSLFIKLNNTSQEGYKVKNFKVSKIELSNKKISLYKKELFKFLSNFQYVINMSFGIILILLFSVYLVIERNNLYIYINEILKTTYIADYLPLYVIVIIGAVAHTTCTTCVSISLEGKHLWIMKSLPLDVKEVFESKALVNISLILIPTVLSFILLSFVFNFDKLWILLSIVYFILLSTFVSLTGLVINLLFPKLEFDREIIVIKQSMSSFLGIYVNILIGMGIAYMAFNLTKLGSAYVLIIIISLFYLVACIGLYFWLITAGVKKFNNL